MYGTYYLRSKYANKYFGDNNPLNIEAGNNNKQIIKQNNHLPRETEKNRRIRG